MKSVSTKSSSPSTILGDFVSSARLGRFDAVASARTDSLTIVLDGVRNFHNISAVMRSADAFGVSTVHLVGTEFHYSKGVSLGTERWLKLERHQSAASAVDTLTKSGFQLVTLEPPVHQSKPDCPASIPVIELPFHTKLALVFGAEKAGVSPEFTNAAKYRAYIPMFGFVDSFNISVAAAITLFCSTVSDGQAKRRVEPVNDSRKEKLLGDWLSKDIRGADAILKHVSDEDEHKHRRKNP